jgi:hypothetical protein
VRTLQNEGLSAPQGATQAIAAARANLGQAIATANGYIFAINGIDAQAYSLANRSASGPCAGDGPGSPSSAIPILNG